MKKKFKNLNIITIIAMFMIYNIHFFNYFSSDITGFLSTNIMNLLRGFSLIAVLLFLVNMACTSVYLEKKINYRSLFLFIIIPTLLFEQINYILFGMPQAEYNFIGGFTGSWYGEMYVYVLLVLPLFVYFKNKYKYLMVSISILFVLCGYYYSIISHSATGQDLRMFMVIPYSGLVYLFYYIIFEIKITFKTNHLIGLTLIGIVLETLAYSGMIENKYIITSYFSPVSIIYTTSIFLIIYNMNFKKSNYRIISRTSYFFYFCHYIIIKSYENFIPNHVENLTILFYILGLVASFVLAYITYNVYTMIINKMQL